jgi:acetylornithine/N-succinyldiaminopimelate aminotransferase
MKFDDYPVHALMEITSRPPLVFTRGEGSWLWDHEGRKYLDFVQGWAVNSLGHCSPVVTRALIEQAARLVNPSASFHNAPALELAKRICEASVFDRVFFASSGAEANEGAIKLARKWGSRYRNGAHEIVTFANAFHGRTLACMSASGKPSFAPLFEPKVPGFPKARLNDISSVSGLIGDKTVAVMVEPIQGEAGVVPASDEFLRELRALASREGLLLIVDEIQTGVGRTGKLWAYEHAGIEPDIMTLGKGLGGGVPLAALVAKESVSCFEHGDQGGTYNGNPLMCAVGCAVMEAVCAPGFLESVREKGEYLASSLRSLSSRLGLGEVRGRGLLQALELGSDIGPRVVELAREAGVLVNSPRAGVLRFMPALNVGVEDVGEGVGVVGEAIGRVVR